MKANQPTGLSSRMGHVGSCRSPLSSVKFFVFCHGLLQLAQLLVSGYLKGSISTIEKRYGLSSSMSGLLACFNEVGNTTLIMFVSYFGSRVHRPRWIGLGALVASLASALIALPHFLGEKYEYSHYVGHSLRNISDLCLPGEDGPGGPSLDVCSQQDRVKHRGVFSLMLLGQLLLGIGGVPIQPFGISYIDDYASKRNSPLYLGIMFAVTVIGPACGYMLGSFLLKFYVDFDKLDAGEKIELDLQDPRWVGAWWLGFLLAAGLLFLTSLPYFFFPAQMPKEEADVMDTEPQVMDKKCPNEPEEDVSLVQFLRGFPQIVLRTLRNPIFLLVILAQVNLAAMVAGLATFMAKFIEQQFTITVSFSNLMLGGVNIPMAMLGIVCGGVVMRRLRLSVRSSAVMCTTVVFISVFLCLPLMFLGCPTQKIAGVSREDVPPAVCALNCSCQAEAFNPVCGSDGVEYRSPCHAGCPSKTYAGGKVQTYTNCSCVGGEALAWPRPCGTSCSHLFIPFMALSGLTGFMASLSQTPSFMMILRTVKPKDKAFALGVQYMMFRVLAFLPGPVLYGSAIDSTCILWGKKCKKDTNCRYYDLRLFRHRFLGLQGFFLFGAFVCFLLSFVVLRKSGEEEDCDPGKSSEMLMKPGLVKKQDGLDV